MLFRSHTNTSTDIPVILIGNKADAPDRMVEYSEGKRVAQNFGIKFFETSAKQGYGLNEAFNALGELIDNKIGENFPSDPTQPGQNMYIKTPELNVSSKREGCSC